MFEEYSLDGAIKLAASNAVKRADLKAKAQRQQWKKNNYAKVHPETVKRFTKAALSKSYEDFQRLHLKALYLYLRNND